MSQFSGIILNIFLLGHYYVKSDPIISEQDSDHSIELFSYVVGIEKNGVNIGGGTLIRTAVVLTAAHYLVGKVQHDKLIVRGGSKYVNMGGVTKEVRDSVYHNKFNADEEIHYNICLLQLKKPFQSGFDGVTVISTATTYNLEEGTLVRVIGWGRYNKDRTKYTSGMSSVMIPVTNDTYCRSLTEWKPGLNGKICAGGKEGATDGDAGGPLIYEAQQIGIAIGGLNGENLPQIYTKVSFLQKWIQEKADTFERYFNSSIPY